MAETEVVDGIQKVLGKLMEEENQKRFKKWNKSIAFTFKELGKTWSTTLTAGVPGDLEEFTIDNSVKYDIQVRTDSKTWLGIINKEIKPMSAITSGDLKIKGKVTDLIKLKRVM
ncbi:MAG: SCP2 sterol-binding domain-containing protein [Candidatus Hodarchaeales archaeon]|jgi:putative sterol carrier protein